MAKDKGGTGRIPALGSATVEGVAWTGDHTVIVADNARSLISQIFGRDVDDTDFAELVGAPDGATVRVDENPYVKGEIRLLTSHPDYVYEGRKFAQERRLYSEMGQVILENHFFSTGRGGSGLGANVFAREVVKARQMGITEIRADAARGRTMNGYYTWPRLGFNATMRTAYDGPDGNNGSQHGRITKALNTLPRGITLNKSTVLDLIRTPKGREWWRENGDWTPMSFNTGRNSRSSAVLRAYMRAKGYNVPDL